jgi:hypothetical protein
MGHTQAFATVNIDDSKTMQVLTKAAAQDSAAMKQIAYVIFVFRGVYTSRAKP